MRCTSLVLALTAGLGGLASAQPGPPPQPPPPPVDTTTTTTTTTSAPVVVTTPPQQRPMQEQTMMASPSEAVTERPDGMSIGLGLGYQLPTSLETPNITSMRLRLRSGLTIEPAFAISNESTTTEMMTTQATDKHTIFSLFALGRLPLISRGKADFEGLARLGFSNDKDNPEGDFNTTTINRFGIGWGMAVGYWFSAHWQLSMNITNDLINYSSTKKQLGAGNTSSTSATDIGLIFSPQVFMMLHLYN